MYMEKNGGRLKSIPDFLPHEMFKNPNSDRIHKLSYCKFQVFVYSLSASFPCTCPFSILSFPCPCVVLSLSLSLPCVFPCLSLSLYLPCPCIPSICFLSVIILPFLYPCPLPVLVHSNSSFVPCHHLLPVLVFAVSSFFPFFDLLLYSNKWHIFLPAIDTSSIISRKTTRKATFLDLWFCPLIVKVVASAVLILS